MPLSSSTPSSVSDVILSSGPVLTLTMLPEVVVVADDGLEHFQILAEQSGDVFQRVDPPDCRHQAAVSSEVVT